MTSNVITVTQSRPRDIAFSGSVGHRDTWYSLPSLKQRGAICLADGVFCRCEAVTSGR